MKHKTLEEKLKECESDVDKDCAVGSRDYRLACNLERLLAALKRCWEQRLEVIDTFVFDRDNSKLKSHYDAELLSILNGQNLEGEK